MLKGLDDNDGEIDFHCARKKLSTVRDECTWWRYSIVKCSILLHFSVLPSTLPPPLISDKNLRKMNPYCLIKAPCTIIHIYGRPGYQPCTLELFVYIYMFFPRYEDTNLSHYFALSTVIPYQLLRVICTRATGYIKHVCTCIIQ